MKKIKKFDYVDKLLEKHDRLKKEFHKTQRDLLKHFWINFTSGFMLEKHENLDQLFAHSKEYLSYAVQNMKSVSNTDKLVSTFQEWKFTLYFNVDETSLRISSKDRVVVWTMKDKELTGKTKTFEDKAQTVTNSEPGFYKIIKDMREQFEHDAYKMIMS